MNPINRNILGLANFGLMSGCDVIYRNRARAPLKYFVRERFSFRCRYGQVYRIKSYHVTRLTIMLERFCLLGF